MRGAANIAEGKDCACESLEIKLPKQSILGGSWQIRLTKESILGGSWQINGANQFGCSTAECDIITGNIQLNMV